MARARDVIKIRDERKAYDKIMRALEFDMHQVPPLGAGYFDSDNATKAAFAEFGTATTQQRPFISRKVDEKSKAYDERLKDGLARVLEGKAKPDDVMKALGRAVKADIEDSIRSGSWAPNKASTIETKESDKPLIDTGKMLASVDYRVGLSKDGEG